jgi:hypothetical protein
MQKCGGGRWRRRRLGLINLSMRVCVANPMISAGKLCKMAGFGATIREVFNAK